METPSRRPILGARCEASLYDAFALAARAEGISISAALRIAARRYIDHAASRPIPDADVAAASEPSHA